jgi:hypothetical protein
MAAASKYILVPEAMYRGLLNASSYSSKEKQQQQQQQHRIFTPKITTAAAAAAATEDDDNLNLKFIKDSFEKTKKKRDENLSNKNINYNQELRRYLKVRNETKNKPIKVKLSNGKH